jgi:predicted metalloprotease
MGRFVSAILGSTELEWKDVFVQAGKTYQPPTLVMFSGATQSAWVCASRHGSFLLSDWPQRHAQDQCAG